jgi:hypothetical protein
MPTPSEIRKLIGQAADNLSDKQVQHIWDLMDRLAGVIFEMWLKHRSGPGSERHR